MKPHKWAKEIHAWADGAEIESFSESKQRWEFCMFPEWEEEIYYRIAEQPKPDDYLYVYEDGVRGMYVGYKPHPAQNMYNTRIIGKIKLEQNE